MKSLINRIIKVIPCEYTLSIRGRMGKGISDPETVPKPSHNHRTMKDFSSFTNSPSLCKQISDTAMFNMCDF